MTHPLELPLQGKRGTQLFTGTRRLVMQPAHPPLLLSNLGDVGGWQSPDRLGASISRSCEEMDEGTHSLVPVRLHASGPSSVVEDNLVPAHHISLKNETATTLWWAGPCLWSGPGFGFVWSRQAAVPDSILLGDLPTSMRRGRAVSLTGIVT